MLYRKKLHTWRMLYYILFIAAIYAHISSCFAYHYDLRILYATASMSAGAAAYPGMWFIHNP